MSALRLKFRDLPSGDGREDSLMLGRFPIPILKITPKCLLLYNFRIGHKPLRTLAAAQALTIVFVDHGVRYLSTLEVFNCVIKPCTSGIPHCSTIFPPDKR